MARTLSDLRRYAIARSLFAPTTLPRAIQRLGFVQADPIRAPARAQDLTLRHRVRGYKVGDLERRYPRLPIEEDFLVNYGFLPRATHALMHPRTPRRAWTKAQQAKAASVLALVRERGVVHPRDVDATLQHGKITNWFGGKTNATTYLLDGLHYRGDLRVAGRERGVRLYALREPTLPAPNAEAAMDTLVDLILAKYAPLPERSLGDLITLLRGGAPQWAHARRDAFARARRRAPSVEIDGIRWFWPDGENPRAARWVADDEVRFLAPFDPVVWDRRRFALFWNWTYTFEAYKPAPKRVRGYYALPLLWRDRVIGWGNLAVRDGGLHADIGYQSGAAPRGKAFIHALDEELSRMRAFLQIL